MIVFCEECGTRYNVDLNNIKGRWHSYHCRECDFLITISREKPTDIISPDIALMNQIGPLETPDPNRKKRILVVDDSKLFRRIIKQILESDGTLEVVGEAADGNEALRRNQELKPDLITLDVNMPGMAGTSVLKRLMLTHPCPVVIISNLSNRSQDTIIDFLRLGAVDFLVKPAREQDPEEVRKNFVKTVYEAASASVEDFTRLNAPLAISTQMKPAGHRIPCRQLSIIISGAGGIAELFNIFSKFPSGFDGTVIVVQTMPKALLSPLVTYLNQICRIPILPIAEELPLVAGHCYIGRGDTVFELKMRQAEPYLAMANDAAPLDGKRENMDSLLRSVADRFPGVFSLTLLSGTRAFSMEALRHFKANSGKIIAKQPSTCMVRDYLEELGESGLTDVQAAPENIVETIINHLDLQCMAVPKGGMNKNAQEFMQRRRHQRIYFTLQTGPRITFCVLGSLPNDMIFRAGITDLSEAGLGFAVTKVDHGAMVLNRGEKIKILAVEGEPQLHHLAGVTAEICWVMDTAEIPFTGYGGMYMDISAPVRQRLRHIVETALQAHQSALSKANC